MVTLTGQNTVVETSAPDVDISRCGMEVWADLMLRGTGSLVATGSQCGIYVSGTLAVDGCKVDARADGAGIADARVAGVIADGLAVRDGGRVVAAGAGSGAGVRANGVYLQVASLGDGAVGAAKLRDGVACTRCGHHAVRHGGVGQPDASRYRDPDGDGLAVRDPRLADARCGRMHHRCPGGWGRYF